MQRGFSFSPPARFSPGAIGALLFPAAFHAPQKSTIFEPAFGLMAMLKTSLCEAWKTIESTSTAPRDRWERSWLWKSGTWLAARLWAGPPYTNKLRLATKNSSEQLSSLKSWCSAWREEQLQLPVKPSQSLCDHTGSISAPTCASQGASQVGLVHAHCRWMCRSSSHQIAWLRWEKSSRVAKSLMSLLFLVPESTYKVFQQSVWTI